MVDLNSLSLISTENAQGTNEISNGNITTASTIDNSILFDHSLNTGLGNNFNNSNLL